MKDKFIKQNFDIEFNVKNIITIFYMEFSKDFHYGGEKHNFWELVYIDKGEMICTADKKQFTLKGGELTFHKPNEFHNLSSNKSIAPNVSITTFECDSPAMNYFEGKIFKLSQEEKNYLSLFFKEGLSAYSLVDSKNPLLQKLKKLDNAPFGSSQMAKNLLEIFLIKLSRNKEILSKNERYHYKFHGENIPYDVKEIIDVLEDNIYNKLSVKQIANIVKKSESSIKTAFSKSNFNGILNYFNFLKIEEAKKLIREAKHNFTQIAEMLCFDTPQYFSIVFKRYTRMSPQEYKNSIMP